MADEYFMPVFTASQAALWRSRADVPNVLDGTMPDLLETSVMENQCSALERTQSRIETEEFLRNEQIVEVVENILDNVEEKQKVEPPPAAVVNEEASEHGQSDHEGDDFFVSSKCSKRPMNESIMSLGDPMLNVERKVAKSQLDGSIMDSGDGGNDMSLVTNFSLSDLLEEMEGQAKGDTAALPAVSLPASSDANQPTTGSILMHFNSPQEATTAPIATEQSPDRSPAFSSLLAGLITPLGAQETPNVAKASDLLSMSIFQTSPFAANEPNKSLDTSMIEAEAATAEDRNVTADVSLKADSSTISAHHLFNESRLSLKPLPEEAALSQGDNTSNQSLSQNDSANCSTISSHYVFNQSLKQAPEEILLASTVNTSSQSLNQSNTAESSIISTHQLFNESRQSLKPLPEEAALSHATAEGDTLNRSLNLSDSVNCSTISSHYVFNQSRQSLKQAPEELSQASTVNTSSQSLNQSNTAESSIISTHYLFDRSLRQSLKPSDESHEESVMVQSPAERPSMKQSSSEDEEEKETGLAAALRELEALNGRLTKLSDHNEQLRAELKEQQVQLENFEQMSQSARAKYAEALAGANEQIASLNDAIRGLEQASVRLEEEKTALEKALHSKEQAIVYQTLQVESMTRLIAKLESESGQLETALKQMKEQMAESENQIQKLADEKSSLETAIQATLPTEVVNANANLPAPKQVSALVELYQESKKLLTELQNQLAAKENAVAVLDQEKSIIEAELSMKKQMLKNLDAMVEESLRDKEQTIADQTLQMESMTCRIAKLQSESEQLETALKQTKEQMAESENQILKLADEKSSLELSLTELQNQVAAKENAVAVLYQEKLKAAATENERQMAETERILGKLRSELDEANSHITELVEEVAAVNMLNDGYVQENADLQEEKTLMQRTIRKLEEEREQKVQGQSAELELLKGKVAQLEAEAAQRDVLEAKCARLEAENEALKVEVTETNDKLGQVSDQLQSTTAKLETIQVELVDVRAMADAKDVHLGELKSQLEALEAKQATLEQEDAAKFGQLSAEKAALEVQVTTLTSELTTTKDRLEESKQKCEQAHQVRIAKETELAAALREQDALNSRLTKLSGHNEQLRAELKEQQVKLENFEQMSQSAKAKHAEALAGANEQIASLNDAIRGLEQASVRLEEEKTALEESLRGKEQTISDQKLQAESMTRRIAKLESESGQLETALKQTKEQMAESENQIQKLADEKSSLEAAIQATLPTEVVNANANLPAPKQVSALVELYQESKKSLTELQNQLAAKENAVAVLDQEKSIIEAELSMKKQMLKNLDAMVDESTTKAVELERKVLQLEKELAALAEVRDEAQKQAAELQRDLERRDATIAEMQLKLRNNEAIKEELHKVLDILDSSETIFDQVQAAKATLESSLSQAQAKLLVEVAAKNKVIGQLQLAHETTKRMQSTMDHLERQHSTLKPIRARLSESVKSGQKLTDSINKLIEQMRTNKAYKESVKTELVRKILLKIQDQVNTDLRENNKVLTNGVEADSVPPPADRPQVLTAQNAAPPLNGTTAASKHVDGSAKKLPLMPMSEETDKENAASH